MLGHKLKEVWKELDIKVVLTATTVILLASLLANAYLWIQQNQITALENQENLKNQIIDLQHQLYNLQTENENLQRKNANLEHQLYYEREPFLVTRLGVSDVLYNPQYRGKSLIPRLYIQGEVWNIGDKIAFNCSLHVVLYQGNVVANETYIELGDIQPWSLVKVDRNIYYEGERLTNWTITPQFTPSN